VSEPEIVAHCRELIAGYKCPRTVSVRSEPLTLSGAGKVLKTVLRTKRQLS
jgi:long-chain acyl-CoA synthetase